MKGECPVTRQPRVKGQHPSPPERFGSDEGKAFELGDNDGGRVFHVHKPPGIVMRQSRKPRPASPSKITTACLQNELADDGGEVELKSRMWRQVPTPLGITDNLIDFLFFLSVGISLPTPLYHYRM